MNDTGKIVQAARVQKSLTPKQLAKQCGVSESYIVDLEAGRKIANESLLKRLSGLLGVNFNTDLGELADVEEKTAKVSAPSPTVPRGLGKESVTKEKPSEQWEMAFGNVLKKVPVYDMQTWQIVDHKLQPILNNKIDGYAPDKVVFVRLADSLLQGMGLKAGDIIKIVMIREIVNNALHLVQVEGKRYIRRIRKLEGDKLLLLDLDRDNKTDVRSSKEIEILGRCFAAEIFFV
jgi:transcriptional regulator with XRE-family HTH domain